MFMWSSKGVPATLATKELMYANHEQIYLFLTKLFASPMYILTQLVSEFIFIQ